MSAEVNKAQFTDCLLGGPLGGYFSPAKQGWANSIQTYDPTDDWTKVFMIDVPPTLYSNLTMVRNFCEVSGTPVPEAIATVIKVAAMHRVTDTYGPIPYSAIENGGDLNTYYDPVDKIYDAFFRDLTEAVNILNDNRLEPPCRQQPTLCTVAMSTSGYVWPIRLNSVWLSALHTQLPRKHAPWPRKLWILPTAVS